MPMKMATNKFLEKIQAIKNVSMMWNINFFDLIFFSSLSFTQLDGCKKYSIRICANISFNKTNACVAVKRLDILETI